MMNFILDAAGSLAAKSAARMPEAIVPPSFENGASLYMFNLFLMTATTFLGAMMVGKQGSRIWTQRLWDHPLHPVTLYRAITFFAGIGITLRCGAEAMFLWGWNPQDVVTTARVSMAKRWIDPIAIGFGLMWMSIVVLGEPGIEHQLRKAPLPVDMWSRWPVLVRALAVIILSFVAALAAVCLR
ncbi:hypothetical protein JQK15_04010 [Sphingobium sp. BHU LFT2]|uniref:hypothetical protein n=1 Tax=Sphingobium sp. BHU LFT2 TaxID=2807634 RepID=UPI001BE64A7A|nr:hypothetical protein [Sphingobium sp. BHU LFT2]MBT2242694.1 hypothetical protein [Sphingobium sp. BHU LFT2]